MKLQDLAPAGVAFVVVALILGIGASILSDIANDQTGVAKDITLNGTEGVQELATWLPTLGLVLAASVIIGTVVAYFAFQ